MTDESAKVAKRREAEALRDRPGGNEPGKGDKGPTRTETRMDRYAANGRTLVGAILLALFIRVVLFEAFEIEGPSMQPTLLDGDRVVVAKCLYGLFLPLMDHAVVTWSMPAPSNVVIVKSPEDNIDIVKRVIGLPGDVIEMRNGVIWRDGKPIPQKDLGPCQDGKDRGVSDVGDCEWYQEKLNGHTYRTSRSLTADFMGARLNAPPVKVPPGDIFIMGDHRDRSNDSRFFGPVPIDRIKGRALLIYWSNGPGIRWHRMFHDVD